MRHAGSSRCVTCCHALVVARLLHSGLANVPSFAWGRWEALEPGQEDEAADVSVAGRIMARRVFGKLAFFTLQVRLHDLGGHEAPRSDAVYVMA